MIYLNVDIDLMKRITTINSNQDTEDHLVGKSGFGSHSSSWARQDHHRDLANGLRRNTLIPINEALRQLHHIGSTKDLGPVNLSNKGNKRKN